MAPRIRFVLITAAHRYVISQFRSAGGARTLGCCLIPVMIRLGLTENSGKPRWYAKAGKGMHPEPTLFRSGGLRKMYRSSC